MNLSLLINEIYDYSKGMPRTTIIPGQESVIYSISYNDSGSGVSGFSNTIILTHPQFTYTFTGTEHLRITGVIQLAIADPGTGHRNAVVYIREDGTPIGGCLSNLFNVLSGNEYVAVPIHIYHTPSSGTHTYSIRIDEGAGSTDSSLLTFNGINTNTILFEVISNSNHTTNTTAWS